MQTWSARRARWTACVSVRGHGLVSRATHTPPCQRVTAADSRRRHAPPPAPIRTDAYYELRAACVLRGVAPGRGGAATSHHHPEQAAAAAGTAWQGTDIWDSGYLGSGFWLTREVQPEQNPLRRRTHSPRKCGPTTRVGRRRKTLQRPPDCIDTSIVAAVQIASTALAFIPRCQPAVA